MTEDEKKIARAKLEKIQKNKQSIGEKENLQVSTRDKSKMKAKSQLMRQQK